jgi:NAD(P)-dependent dehydrogenase (short-subunit alcohol dehydrogenase family)
MKLQGKVAVVTGASTGLGKEVAAQLAAGGAAVALSARNEERLRDNVRSIEGAGGRAIAVVADVTSRKDVASLFQRTVEAFGRLDLIVSNAGVTTAPGTFLENDEADVRRTLETNFMAGLYAVWEGVPYLRRTGGGTIVFVTSAVGKRGVPRSAVYCASKFAVHGLAESIRPELRPENIRVITVCPPGVDTPFFENNGRTGRHGFPLHPAADIARGIVSAIERDKRDVLLTLDAKLLYWGNVFAPRIMDRVLGKIKGAK